MHPIQTEGAPPQKGRAILPTMGSSQKSKKALAKMAAANKPIMVCPSGKKRQGNPGIVTPVPARGWSRQLGEIL